VGKLNRRNSIEYPDDPALRAWIKRYELGCRMLTAVPGIVDFTRESHATKRLNGIDHPTT
jgi:hypothetical protein